MGRYVERCTSVTDIMRLHMAVRNKRVLHECLMLTCEGNATVLSRSHPATTSSIFQCMRSAPRYGLQQASTSSWSAHWRTRVQSTVSIELLWTSSGSCKRFARLPRLVPALRRRCNERCERTPKASYNTLTRNFLAGTACLRVGQIYPLWCTSRENLLTAVRHQEVHGLKRGEG